MQLSFGPTYQLLFQVIPFMLKSYIQSHGAFETVMFFLAPYLHSYQLLYVDDFSLFMPDEVCLPLNTQRRSPPLLKPKALPHVLWVLKCLSHACVFIHSYVNNCTLQYDLLECLNFYFAFIPQLLI